MRYGAIEAGGTKMVCAVGTDAGEILKQTSIPTTTPEETMPQVLAYLADEDVAAVGVACFGPIDLNRDSPTYGHILQTTKLAWRGYDVVGAVHGALGVPVGFDTDVNGSLLGEVTWGAAKGLSDVVYLTIGTGIGGGVLSGGHLVHGMMHPEVGHMLLPQSEEDHYVGVCPYHGHCLEGLASGPAIEGRWGASARELPVGHPAWALESVYLARAIVNLIMVLSPQRIILGGGVMHQAQLFPMVRERVQELLGGYIATAEMEDLAHYIVPASLHDDQGILGAVKLAMDAAR